VSTIRFGYADTPLGQLHYAESGTSGVPVIALHQTPRSWDEYADVLPLFGEHRRLIAMDMYGFGMSAKPEPGEPQTIQQYAAGVLALADALELREFAVLGHHTGAVVAIEVAAAVPDRVSALVLSSPALTDAEYRLRHADGPGGVDDAVVADDGSHLTTWWAQRSPFYPPGRPDILNRFVRDALATNVDPLEGHIACARYVMEDRLDLITAPVAILAGDADPFAFPDAEPIKAALTAARSVEITVIEGGTIPMLEQLPGEVTTAVLGFLDRVEEPAV
jgi:pimeloyl-ACP methyl ester carboxylesterase